MVKKNKHIKLVNGKGLYSFNQCFSDMFPTLCNFADKYLGNHEIARDVVQDVFIKVWNIFEDFENELKLKAYLFRSVRNGAINHIRHHEVKDKYFSQKFHELNSEPTFLETVLEEETHRLIYNAIEALPEKQKQVIYFNILGLSNEEIADKMKVSVNTVKTHKARAYKQLKQSLDGIYCILLFLLS